jgi:hypothetical protein
LRAFFARIRPKNFVRGPTFERNSWWGALGTECACYYLQFLIESVPIKQAGFHSTQEFFGEPIHTFHFALLLTCVVRDHSMNI